MSISEQIKSMYITIAGRAYSEATYTTVYRDVSHAQLAVTLCVSLAVLIFVWMLFEYLAQRESTSTIYRQRLTHPKCVEATHKGKDNRSSPPDCKWMGSVLLGSMRIPEAELAHLMGIGGYLSYRIMRHCLFFSVIALLYGGLVILPVYISQHGHSARDKTFLGMIVANNISDNNPSHTWVLVISSYLLCAYWCIILHFEWQIVKQMQLTFEQDNRATNRQVYYSIMIEGTPKCDVESIRNDLPRLVGSTTDVIHSVVPTPDTTVLRSLNRRIFWYQFIPAVLFFRSTKEESLVELRQARAAEIDRLRDINEPGSKSSKPRALKKRGSTIAELQLIESSSPEKSIGNTTMRTTSSLFGNMLTLFVARPVKVYFVTMWSSSIKILLALMYNREVVDTGSESASVSRISPAPPPTDIIWKNINVSYRVLRNRQFFVRIILVVVAVGYAYPISRIQDYAKMDSKDTSQDEAVFGSNLWFRQFLSVNIPAIIQLVLTQLIPVVLRLVSLYYERRKTYQDVSKYVLHRSFLLQLLTVYVIVFGDLWGDVSKLSGGIMYFYNSLVMRFKRLGNEIPPVGHYFASTIIIAILTEVGLQMLNPVQLFLHFVRSRTDESKSSWTNSKLIQYKYSSSYSFVLTLVNIMFTFCLITPVVMAVSCIFWAINQIWTKYALIYLNNRRYEIGTAFSPVIFSAFATSLLLSQLAVFVVLMSMDTGKWEDNINPQVFSTGVLVGFVLVFKYVIMHNFVLNETQSYQRLQLMNDPGMDSRANLESKFSRSYYMHPDLKGPDSQNTDKSENSGIDEDEVPLIQDNPNP